LILDFDNENENNENFSISATITSQTSTSTTSNQNCPQQQQHVSDENIENNSNHIDHQDSKLRKISTFFSPFYHYNKLFNKDETPTTTTHHHQKTDEILTNEVFTVSYDIYAHDPIEEDEEEEVEMTEEEMREEQYAFIASISQKAFSKEKRQLLPKKEFGSPKYTLVLDLDETLVNCTQTEHPDAEFFFPVVYESVTYQVYVKTRPYWKEFLKLVSPLFEVVIFTASQEIYAKTLLDFLDPTHTLIKHRLYRDSCVNVEGNYIKDLENLGRDLSKVIIVDNSPQAFAFQINNGIPIQSWYGDRNDSELETMIPVLKRLLEIEDVRPQIKQIFGLEDKVKRFEIQN